MHPTRLRGFPQHENRHHAGIPNWGFGNAQVSPTRDACIFWRGQIGFHVSFHGQRISGSLWVKAAAAQQPPRPEAAPQALELYRVP